MAVNLQFQLIGGGIRVEVLYYWSFWHPVLLSEPVLLNEIVSMTDRG
jgi:hypothetical protein